MQNSLIRRQNLCHQAANLQKNCAACSKNFPCTPKNLYCTPKKYHLYYKKSICTAKIAISTFSPNLGILLSFWHTFKYFCILSQLLAHCADLSKSKEQLCCCHETGLKLVLFDHDSNQFPNIFIGCRKGNAVSNKTKSCQG